MKVELSSEVALSFRQPWLYFMLSLPAPHRKNIENRGTAWKHRGPLWFHASSTDEDEYEAAVRWARRAGVPKTLIPPFGSPLYLVGGIIGRGSFVGNIIHPSPLLHHPLKKNKWWMPNKFGYEVVDAESVPRVECKGFPGLWRVPMPVLEQLRAS